MPPIAVVGMAGAGKSEVTRLLVDLFGFESIYFGQVVLDEIAARDLPPGPASERLVREELRHAGGMDVMAARTLPRIREALANDRRVCIDGLYSGAEWRLLSIETGVLTLAVHSPRWLRKDRLAARAIRPLSSSELDERDVAEVERLDKATPIALADDHLVNDADRASLEVAVRRVIKNLAQSAAACMKAI